MNLAKNKETVDKSNPLFNMIGNAMSTGVAWFTATKAPTKG